MAKHLLVRPRLAAPQPTMNAVFSGVHVLNDAYWLFVPGSAFQRDPQGPLVLTPDWA